MVIADLHRSPITKINVVRLVFGGKLRDEQDTLWVLRQYGVRFAVSDSRPETTIAKRMQLSAREHGIKIWRAEYNTAPSNIEVQENEREGMVKLDRTMTLDRVHYNFQQGLSVALPQNYGEIDRGDFAREMCAGTKVPTKWMGRDCYVWNHQGPDHKFHAWGYLDVAIRLSNMLAFGGVHTMMATQGMVASSLRRNIATVDSAETGRKDGVVVGRGHLDWKKIEKEDEASYFEV